MAGLLWLGGCAARPPQEARLTISGMTSSLGALDDAETTDRQAYGYRIILENRTDVEQMILSIEPRLVDAFRARLLEDDLQLVVGRGLAPGETLEVEGRIAFDATELSKEEILAFEPFVEGFDVRTERFLPRPGGR
jgi:hypothetical protein